MGAREQGLDVQTRRTKKETDSGHDEGEESSEERDGGQGRITVRARLEARVEHGREKGRPPNTRPATTAYRVDASSCRSRHRVQLARSHGNNPASTFAAAGSSCSSSSQVCKKCPVLKQIPCMQLTYLADWGHCACSGNPGTSEPS